MHLENLAANGLQILTDAAAVAQALPDRPCGRRPVDTDHSLIRA
jgi:hypothetical protein